MNINFDDGNFNEKSIYLAKNVKIHNAPSDLEIIRVKKQRRKTDEL